MPNDTAREDEALARFMPGKESHNIEVGEIDAAALLDDVYAFLRRFVAFPLDHHTVAVTLWAAHAHVVEHFHTSPRLALLSPEPESGKTRALELLQLLTLNTGAVLLSPSPATIFRKLAQEQVTLLIDEVDTIFTKRGKEDQNEDLRALLNAGYRRGACIPRCVGPRHEVQDFPVFAAVAMAGLGDLPDTIITRAITIPMRRRSAKEPIEQYRIRLHEKEGHLLRDRLAGWAIRVGAAVGGAFPQLPDGVVDRRAEAWEPLIAIADSAGGDWPKRARVAAVADVAAYRERTPSLGIRLLIDLKRVFGDAVAMSTVSILEALIILEDSPWAEIKGGKPIDQNGLAKRLKPYGVKSTTVRIGASTPRGYKREDLYDAWERYIPSPPHPSATSATPETVGPSVSPLHAAATCATPATSTTRSPPTAPATSTTTATSTPLKSGSTCLRCDGEGCPYCTSDDRNR
jgi:hypothetical protein